MLYNKKSLILSSTIILLLCSSCLDFSSKEGVSQDLTPLIDGIINYQEFKGDKNAMRWVQELYKDRWLQLQ